MSSSQATFGRRAMDELLETTFRCPVCKRPPSEPVLLECLHSCCSLCLHPHPLGDGERAATVWCPQCRSDSQVAAASNDDANAFVEAKVKVATMFGGASACDLCLAGGGGRSSSSSDAEQEGAAADWWCNECCKVLCEACKRQHKSTAPKWHQLLPLCDARGTGRAAMLALTALCSAHGGRKCEFVCMTCKAVKCGDCIRACSGAGHMIEHALQGGGGSSSKELVDGVARELRVELRAVQSAAANIGTARRLVGVLASARSASKDALRRNKRIVIDAVDEAFSAADRELDKLYEALDARAEEVLAAAEPLEAPASHGAAYATALLDAGDPASLLRQREPLLARLRSLGERLRVLPTVRIDEAQRCVSVESAFPDNMAAICRSWIGVPTRCSDVISYACDVPTAPSQDPGNTRHGQGMSPIDISTYSDFRLLEVAPAAAQFTSQDCCSFDLPFECLDLAVSADGRSLLLAAAESGLRELDAFSGAELSAWRCVEQLPPDVRGASESVTAVDALQDGRVAVGLRCAHRVALLVRDASGGVRQSWRLDGTVVELQSRPLRLAVHGSNVVAVAENFPPQLVLATLPPLESGRGSGELLRRKWDYVISSVAATAQVVVTAGLAKTTLLDGREGYLLECYSHSGERLWRQLRSSEVLDMCAAAAGRFQSSSSVTVELCLLLKGSNVVTMLRASDGQLLRTHDEVIAAPSDGSKSPMQLLRLSLCSSDSQTTVLAALACDRKTVAVHRRHRSALLD